MAPVAAPPNPSSLAVTAVHPVCGRDQAECTGVAQWQACCVQTPHYETTTSSCFDIDRACRGVVVGNCNRGVQ